MYILFRWLRFAYIECVDSVRAIRKRTKKIRLIKINTIVKQMKMTRKKLAITILIYIFQKKM